MSASQVNNAGGLGQLAQLLAAMGAARPGTAPAPPRTPPVDPAKIAAAVRRFLRVVLSDTPEGHQARAALQNIGVELLVIQRCIEAANPPGGELP